MPRTIGICGGDGGIKRSGDAGTLATGMARRSVVETAVVEDGVSAPAAPTGADDSKSVSAESAAKQLESAGRVAKKPASGAKAGAARSLTAVDEPIGRAMEA
eukprot:3602292-Pleurochrysis_carterae.AAC.1